MTFLASPRASFINGAHIPVDGAQRKAIMDHWEPSKGHAMTDATGAAELRPLQIETNGINVITDAERKGHPRDLFWPWFAANVSVLGAELRRVRARLRHLVLAGGHRRRWSGSWSRSCSAGSSRWPASAGSAPTMVLSRAAFGVRGNKLPSLISWLLTVGWETVLIILATLATATVFEPARLGRRHRHQGDRADRGGGADHRRRRDGLRPDHAHADGDHLRHRGADRGVHRRWWPTRSTGTRCPPSRPARRRQFIGALVFVMTGFGLGWVNAAADYSRYLPRRSSGRGVIGWTTFGSSLAPVVLLMFGLLLAGSSARA